MLHILAGRAGGGQLDTILKRMGSSPSPCVLIVPEHYSHETERALCRALGPMQSARCEVLSFTRLARRVAETVGGVADQVLDQGGRILLMHKAVAQVSSHLSVYRVPSRKPSFLAGLSATVDECKSYSVAPETLIKAVIAAGYTDFNLISNNTSVQGRGIGLLVHENRIKHITCSHIGSNKETVAKVVAGEIDVTFTPQGTLCERIRAGGAGIGGVLTPTGLGTPMEEGKQVIEVDGKKYILETPLHADLALIHAWKVDKMGNCIFHRTARNFNEPFATAADWVICEAEEIVEVGELDPDMINTPGALVDMVVQARKVER